MTARGARCAPDAVALPVYGPCPGRALGAVPASPRKISLDEVRGTSPLGDWATGSRRSSAGRSVAPASCHAGRPTAPPHHYQRLRPFGLHVRADQLASRLLIVLPKIVSIRFCHLTERTRLWLAVAKFERSRQPTAASQRLITASRQLVARNLLVAISIVRTHLICQGQQEGRPLASWRSTSCPLQTASAAAVPTAASVLTRRPFRPRARGCRPAAWVAAAVAAVRCAGPARTPPPSAVAPPAIHRRMRPRTAPR